MSSIRDVQLKSYEILNIVVDICEKHNITYYLSSGTLLGAIRHQGFIPWDNDIDIEMPIHDYKRFLRIAKHELPCNLFLQTYYSDPGYNEMWAKIRDIGTTSLPIIWKNLNINWGIGIDIFPLVGIYNSPLLQQLQKKLHNICRMLLSKDLLIAISSKELDNKKLRIILTLPRCLRIALCRLIEKLTFKKIANSKSVTMVYTDLDIFLKREAYKSTAQKHFETRNFSIPVDYDYILTTLYGNYMSPPRVRTRRT